jgi:hypothetical protein
LVIDDNALVGKTIKRLLSGEHDVVVEQDARVAVDGRTDKRRLYTGSPRFTEEFLEAGNLRGSSGKSASGRARSVAGK